MSTAPARIQRRPLTQTVSREAFRVRDGSRSARILAYLQASGGAADFEITAALGDLQSAVSGDRRHLVERGLVYATNERRTTPRGCEAVVWRAGKGPQVPPFVPPNAITDQIEMPGVRP